MELDDVNDRRRAKKLKKAVKKFSDFSDRFVTSQDHSFEELDSMREVLSSVFLGGAKSEVWPALIDGAQIPDDRYEDFCKALEELKTKHHIELPVIRRVLDNTIFARTPINMGKVSDKQKIFKLVNDYSAIVKEYGGVFVAQGGEGRLKAGPAHSLLDEDVLKLYAQVKEVFDPYKILNPGVKEVSEPKELVDMLRKDYDMVDFAEHSPYA